MIHTKDLQVGTVLEVTQEHDLLFFGDIFSRHQELLKKGEQYRVTKVRKSSPITVSFEQIDGKKNGDIFREFFKDSMKIISQPDITPKPEHTNANTLAENEEFILVKKGDATQFFKDFLTTSDDHYQPLSGDVLTFVTKVGQRKKIKNMLTLHGVMNMMSGMMNSSHWYYYFQSSQDANKKEQEHHLSIFDDAPYWFNSRQIGNLEALKELEVRKYSKETRKVSEHVVDFDCYEYVMRFIEKTQHIRLFGIGVASVVYNLWQEDKLEEYPYLFSSKFDYTQFEYDTPQEKDIYLDLAFKALKLKKKDMIHYNNKGYSCVAFKTEKERDDFVAQYKNTEKNVFLYQTQNVLDMTEKKESKATFKLK